jgi:hypothetical protein
VELIMVEIRTGKKPGRITLAPEGLKLKWAWKDGIARVEVPKVEIHEIIVVS